MTPNQLACVAATLVLLSLGGPALAQGSPSASRSSFTQADLNNDGKIGLDEFHKDIVRGFHALDFDRDGSITDADIRSLPDRAHVRALERMLRRADADKDGKLSFSEVVKVRMSDFDAADTDNDSMISLAEALAFDAKRREQLQADREMRRQARAASR
ncbi:MAG: EF-hand domain-containing protein [Burkholderiales bacterium]